MFSSEIFRKDIFNKITDAVNKIDVYDFEFEVFYPYAVSSIIEDISSVVKVNSLEHGPGFEVNYIFKKDYKILFLNYRGFHVIVTIEDMSDGKYKIFLKVGEIVEDAIKSFINKEFYK